LEPPVCHSVRDRKRLSVPGPIVVRRKSGERTRYARRCGDHRLQVSVGTLFLDSGRDIKVVVAEMTRSGSKIVIQVKEALIAALIALKIDILVIDPVVKAHRVTENDNMLMDAVATVFADIAAAANCSVELVQHTRKTNGEEVTLEDARRRRHHCRSPHGAHPQ
jgi:hypothetical protein